MSITQFIVEKIGINRTTAYWWIHGKRPVSRRYAPKLAALFGIDEKRFMLPDLYGDPWPEVKKIYDHNLTAPAQQKKG